VRSPPESAPTIDLSIVIPALHEADNLALLLPRLRSVLEELSAACEIVVVDRNPDQATLQVTDRFGAHLIEQQERGYGGALIAGFEAARGAHILTMDADLSHPPLFIKDLWERRHEAKVVIASRYVPGGGAHMPFVRRVLSRVLNIFFTRGLSLSVRDMSSGFRLYDASALRHLRLQARDFDIVQEILVRVFCEGWSVGEVPFTYAPRQHGSSHARVLAFGMAYLRTFATLYRLRNSILSADYDDRAYDSPILPQRYWQRQRFRHVTALIAGHGPTLDVGCGSSRIIGALPPGSVSLDILMRKLRHARKFGTDLAQASAFRLPFGEASFPCVLCSQVIEHVPKESPILDELCRVLKPGGRLVIGTPDYGGWQWPAVEAVYQRAMPSAYADEHIAHYTRRELVEFFRARGYRHEETRYILGGELIMALRKPG
jgi:dolichol-phosphate mannosyltransferase